MSVQKRTSSAIQEIWRQLNTQWHGDDADAFYREYIVKLCEIVDSFDDACSELSRLSEECMKELNSVKQALDNQ